MRAFCGLLIVVGAAAGWHYWHIDGFSASAAGLFGILICANSGCGGSTDVEDDEDDDSCNGL